jgi:Ca2+-binding EF-hand superfamily protein
MKYTSTVLTLGLIATGWPVSAAPDLSKLPPPSTQTGVTYEKDIRPILENSCFRCHGEQRPRGGLRLDSLESVLKGGEDGAVVKPGDSKDSLLVVAVAQIDEETAMPPKRRPGGGRGPGGRGGFGPGMMLSRQMLVQGDKNGDQKLSKSEMTALADTWFDKLDPDKTGKVTQEQFVEHLGEVLPPPPGMRQRQEEGNRGGRGFGPGRFIGPGFFAAADANKDGTLTRDEFKATFAKWYAQWDTEKSGALGEEKIRDGLNSALPQPNFGGGPGGPGAMRGPGGGGPGGPGGPGGGPGGPRGGFGPPPPPLTAEQVGLVRAWIDQGAK